MTEAYTFRYLNADGSFNSVAVVQLSDWHCAEISAENLMPEKAASVEIWCGNDLVSIESRERPDALNHSLARTLSHR
jgi:hypothetical protein